MCTYSMVADDFLRRKFPENTAPYIPTIQQLESVSRQEFESLRKEVLALKDLLTAAKKFDDATNQPDCEMAEKKQALGKLAKMLGVDL